jgi:Na+-transporting NADH:ubiquinone oxidoreductase subunit NqrD
MNRRFNSHLFWGYHSPLSAFTGIGFVILASSRLAFAIIGAGALVWVYGLAALVFSAARPILPARGRMIILLFLSSFLCGVFMMLIGFFNPLLILGAGFSLFLIPPCCLGSGFFENSESVYPEEVTIRAVQEALVIGGITAALALVREPIGMGTISFPGGAQGIIELFNSEKADAFIPVRILSSAAGGLLLLGYGTAAYRYFREQSGGLSPAGGAREEE